MGGGIPERWIPYNNLGSVIPGTRFIAFKVPLKEALCRGLPEQKMAFTPCNLMDQCPKLSLVIDLTNTTRYYDQRTFEEKSVRYEKIFCPGHVIPPKDIVRRFFRVVDAFLEDTKEEQGLIGVHCTHGVNRTGYFICKYMIERLGMPAEAAINDFATARGHRIERENYIKDLLGTAAGPGGSQRNSGRQSPAAGGGGYREWRLRHGQQRQGEQAGSRRRPREADHDHDLHVPAKRAFRPEQREQRQHRRFEEERESRVGSPLSWRREQQQQHPGPLAFGPPPPPHGARHGPPQGSRAYGRPPPPYGPPRGPSPHGRPYQGPPHGPPQQGRPYQGPPPHGPPQQGRPYQGPPPHGPPQQGRPYQVPPHGQPRGRPYQQDPPARGPGSSGRPERSRSRPSRIAGYDRAPVGGDRGPGPLD